MKTIRLKIRSLQPYFGLIILSVWLCFGILQGPQQVSYTRHPWDESMDPKIGHPQAPRNISEPLLMDLPAGETWSPLGFKDLLEVPRTTCRRLMSMGGGINCSDCHTCLKDGNKFTCFDEDVRPSSRDCLVYSFGVGGDVSWDNQMNRMNCSVFAFDMTMENATKTSMFKRGLHFIPIGIAPENYDANIRMTGSTHKRISIVDVAYRSLQTIRDLLGHKKVPIDVLKIDIENSEWEVFESFFESEENSRVLRDVKQIALEIHLDMLKNETLSGRVQGAQRMEKVLKQLDNHGFKMVHTELNSAFQMFASVNGVPFPLFRESLFINRPSR